MRLFRSWRSGPAEGRPPPQPLTLPFPTAGRRVFSVALELAGEFDHVAVVMSADGREVGRRVLTPFEAAGLGNDLLHLSRHAGGNWVRFHPPHPETGGGPHADR